MSTQAEGTPVTIQPYGKGGFFNGANPTGSTRIVELTPDLTERFIDTLDARADDGQVDSMKLHEKIQPIGRAIGKALRDRLAETQDEPLCRKGSAKNCGVGISLGFSTIVFDPEGDGKDLQPHITTHVQCGTALMGRVESNAAAEAPIQVENASPNLQFDIGCYQQMETAAELAGQMMLEQLTQLEA